jgi:hypothetical protein
MMKYNGFYELISYLISEMISAGCNTVHFGDQSEYERNKIKAWPMAHISPVSFSVTDGSNRVITLELFVFTKVTLFKLSDEQQQGSEYGQKNNIDALDTTMWVIEQALVKLRARNVLIGTAYYNLEADPIFTAVTDEGTGDVTGWIGQLNIRMNGNQSKC